VIEAIAGRRVAADTDLLGLGLRPLPADFAELRWSLTNEEILRYRQGAAAAVAAVEQACNSFAFGDSELEIAGLLDYFVRRAGCNPTVTLVAADERIGRFRHPIPTAKKAEHYVMLVCCAEYKGLISCLTRFVAFRPMVEMTDRQQAVANIDAAVNLSTRPGRTLGDLFGVLQEAYARHGFDGEWKRHHQGGPTGYANREAVATPDSTVTVRENQAFAWNPSLPGAKCEDTILCTADEIEVLTAPSGSWPKIVGNFEGRALARADILVR
jgi:Xaa-Pro aminopeptidase